MATTIAPSTSSPSKNRKGPRPLALSLFSGAGGMDLGADQAGFRIHACIELDPHCVETLKAWTASKRPKPQILHADIRSIDPRNLMGKLGLRPGKLDLLLGGP